MKEKKKSIIGWYWEDERKSCEDDWNDKLKKKKIGSEVVRGEGLVAEKRQSSSKKKKKSVEDKCDNKRNCVLYQK